MKSIFQIDPELDIPIYQQLVDKIRAAVKTGALAPDQQLPTVQEVSAELGIARGTIKRAYDELERHGLVEKVQGRGTFVRWQQASSGSRKEQAMVAIDRLLDKLEGIGFSTAEINIFLNLKLRERAEHLSQVQLAVIGCNPENLSQMSEQLRQLRHVDLYSYLLSSIREYPYKLGEDIELIVTTAEHADYLEAILPDRKRIVKVAMKPCEDTVAQLLQLPADCTIGLLSSSSHFGELMHRTCQTYAGNARLLAPQLFSSELDVDAFLTGMDAVLVPKGFEKYCTPQDADQLRSFARSGKLILCAYELDEGSCLYLQERVSRILEEKTL